MAVARPSNTTSPSKRPSCLMLLQIGGRSRFRRNYGIAQKGERGSSPKRGSFPRRAKLVEGRDFITLTQKGERNEGVRGASISIDYHLTIEAAKHIAMMGARM